MGSVRDISDDEYSAIADKSDIGFIDFDNYKSVCNYNPSEDSQIVNISVPFPLVNGKPKSGFVNERIFDPVTITNISSEPLDLWSVSIYDSKPLDSFTISLMEPPTAESDAEYIQNFIESVSIEDRIIKTNRDLKVWVSCKPKEIGIHTAAIHFSVGDETIEKVVFVLAEDKISRSLSTTRPYQRSQKKKQTLVNMNAGDAVYVVGQRPSNGPYNRRPTWNRLENYPIPWHIREMISNDEIPDVVNRGLTDINYSDFFKALVAMEEIKLEEDMKAYGMESVVLKRKNRWFLTLEVPGLAEKRPSLVSGDFIFAKLADDQTADEAYQGYIHRVEAEEIYLKFDPKFHNTHIESNLFNVQFNYNRVAMRRLYQAIESAHFLKTDFLFPSYLPTTQSAVPTSIVPISHTLNEEQITAIEMILAKKGGAPYLIHGPPGTGKTMTLIEAILQIYRWKRNSRILVCAPSNSAADHILERLLREDKVHIRKHDIFRLNAATRPFDDVNPNHIDYCYYEDCIFRCLNRQQLENCRIVISTYTSASQLYSEGIKRGHFSYFFLDEAGQASEPETMVALSNLYSEKSTVVLAGDHLQLGPVVFSREAERFGLGKSYLERLFNCDLYINNDQCFMMKLVRNYRSHKAILHLPSNIFYGGELKPYKEDDTEFLESLGDLLPNKEFPLLFMGIQGCDEREGNNPSWFNRTEASKVVEIINVLIKEKGLVEGDIGVITPYRQQVSKIRGALEGLDFGDVKVGSVEQFQGQEKKVIIISTVRSTITHNEFDKVHYLGFLSNPRRFNVAITRARSLLVVIGNPHILCKDSNWSDLLWYCVEHDSYKGCFLPKREVFSDEAECDHKSSQGNWGDGWATSEEPNNKSYDVGYNEGETWTTSGVEWGIEEPSNKSYDVGYNEGKPWTTSGVEWGMEENSNKSCSVGNDTEWKMDQEQQYDWKPSDAEWGDDRQDHWKYSGVKWGDDRQDHWKDSGLKWGEDEPSNLTTGEQDHWKYSDVEWR